MSSPSPRPHHPIPPPASPPRRSWGERTAAGSGLMAWTGRARRPAGLSLLLRWTWTATQRSRHGRWARTWWRHVRTMACARWRWVCRGERGEGGWNFCPLAVGGGGRGGSKSLCLYVGVLSWVNRTHPVLPLLQGRRMWCHFGQRLERPGFVQAVLPGGRGHQDELFSYVVLRRGPRQRVRVGGERAKWRGERIFICPIFPRPG